jgi:hypothetical protein
MNEEYRQNSAVNCPRVAKTKKAFGIAEFIKMNAIMKSLNVCSNETL